MWQRVSCLILAGALSTSIAAAQDVATALQVCRAEKDDVARLACYDRIGAGQDSPVAKAEPAPSAPRAAEAQPAPSAPPAASPAAPETAATPAPQPPAVAATPQQPSPQEFGYRGGALARADAAQTERKSEEDETLIATVTEVTRRARGELVVTLDNGQTWVQKAADYKFNVKYGDKVRIEEATLRSYIMYREDSNRGTRVTRIR